MKTVLIDSHVLLWWYEYDNRLLAGHKKLLDHSNIHPFLSIASLYELYIKSNVGKLELPDDLELYIKKSELEILHISFNHLNVLKTLPLHHRDPFDRMIISQAITEKIPVISYDRRFEEYDIELI